uniref:NADH-ubiquinone oxidoreductase chain 4L n=1 Tax=Cnemaspis limi TaxID=460617 RepID=K9JVR7_CNELI|nr:NADH dehydrogenase subunit 4L [Cnemaspis limi]ADY86103.1 NADH dehydrogenase subunit 4L [Cnemaspis limi]
MTTQHFIPMMTLLLGLLGLTLHRKHLISALLCIESMMLSLFILLATISYTLNITSTIQPLALLTIAACGEGAGLALLVATTRTHASDHLKTLNLLQC